MGYRELFEGYLDGLSRKSSAPGGGSAASLVFSIGVSLMEMAVNFSINKENKHKLGKSVSLFRAEREKIFPYIDLDADIFRQVLETKGQERKNALRKLNDITFDLGTSCIKILRASNSARKLIKKGIMSDFDIGVECVKVALFASVKNMEANRRIFGIKNTAKTKYLENHMRKA